MRVVKIDGEPWFVAADVCKALGLASCKKNGYSRHLKKLNAHDVPPASEYGVRLPGHGMTHANIISESGLYQLVMRSDKEEARRFQSWVTGTVLPAIRKDGAYIMGEEKVASGERHPGEAGRQRGGAEQLANRVASSPSTINTAAPTQRFAIHAT